MANAADAGVRSRPMTREEKKVILASSAGTIFEWYDFYLYGSLASIIGAQFFTPFPEATRNVFALLAFAAGFIVRPFGALVFGMMGDLIGRKYTFLMTIMIMGLSTFLVGMLPSYYSWGIAAPIILIALRMLQGLALGGEYGGAAVYVAEHAPAGPPRLLHLVHPDHGDPWSASVADRDRFGAGLRQRRLSGTARAGRRWRGNGCRRRFGRDAKGLQRLGLAHPVPGVDHPSGDLALHPSADERIPGLQEDEGRRRGSPKRRCGKPSATGRTARSP